MSGTATLRADGRWMVTLSVRGVRRYRYGRTAEEAHQKFATLTRNVERGSTAGLRARTRRERTTAYIAAVLTEARAKQWDDAWTARVLAAQLAPRRIKRDVFGPCACCGTWEAATVDHIIASSRGGSDTAENLTSACWSCNSRKSDRDHSLLVSLSTRATE